MMRGFCLEVSGPYACFTRPEMKVERVSYDVITPSAARAIFEAVLWKPAIRWRVTQIEVLAPIKWISVRRSEVGAVASTYKAEIAMRAQSGRLGFYVEENRVQRAGMFLRDVKYRLHAWFEFIAPEKPTKASYPVPASLAEPEEIEQTPKDETEAKYAAMFERRARKGQCFHQPYLGCREFAASFLLVNPKTDPAEAIADSRDLGWMLYDLDYSNPADPKPLWFHPVMSRGIIPVPDRGSPDVRR
jgi:CRISPR-associated protein Cas5d